MIRYVPSCISSTEQISPSSRRGVVAVLVYPFVLVLVLEYISVMAEPAAECSSVFEAEHHHHGKMWCVLATYSPTLWTRSLHGLMSSSTTIRIHGLKKNQAISTDVNWYSSSFNMTKRRCDYEDCEALHQLKDSPVRDTRSQTPP